MSLGPAFGITAWEHKNLNHHRAVLQLTGNGETFTNVEFDALREEITSQFRISKLKGFGFGVFFNNFEVQNHLLRSWIDNSTKKGQACQWVVVCNRQRKAMVGCHMWQKGITTPIYETILKEAENSGFNITNTVREAEGFMKFAAMISPAIRLSRYHPTK